jgi:hypothetical protein
MKNIAAWSFSRLKDHEKCPLKAYLKYVEKKPTDHMDRTAADRGTQIHLEAELFVKGEGPFTENLDKFTDYFDILREEFDAGTVELEEDWAFTSDWEVTGWFDKDAWCRMKLDNCRHRDYEDGELVSAISTDYKTGKKYGNEVSHGQQGQIYAIGTFMRYPTLETIDVEFIYLDLGPKQTTRRTYTRAKAMKLFPSWNKRAKAMTEATDFPPKPNKITCMWCEFGPQHGDGSCEWGV